MKPVSTALLPNLIVSTQQWSGCRHLLTEIVDWSPGDMFKNGTGHCESQYIQRDAGLADASVTQVVWKETTNLGCGQLFCGVSLLISPR
jgi:hypothetical protein